MDEVAKNDVIKRIQDLCDAKGWSLYKLSNESHIPYSSLNNMFLRNTQPTISSLEKICTGLNITLSDFFATNTPMEISNYDLTAEERDIVDTFRVLSRNDKRLFHAFLKGLTKK